MRGGHTTATQVEPRYREIPRLGHNMHGTAHVEADRRPDRTTVAERGDVADTERADMPGTDTWVRFRCNCGRSVATPEGSDAADRQLCSRCRERAAYRAETYRREV